MNQEFNTIFNMLLFFIGQVLVHGEQNEMQRLKSALVREYEENSENIKVYNPRNTVGVDFYFTGEKTAKVYIF